MLATTLLHIYLWGLGISPLVLIAKYAYDEEEMRKVWKKSGFESFTVRLSLITIAMLFWTVLWPALVAMWIGDLARFLVKRAS